MACQYCSARGMEVGEKCPGCGRVQGYVSPLAKEFSAPGFWEVMANHLLKQWQGTLERSRDRAKKAAELEAENERMRKEIMAALETMAPNPEGDVCPTCSTYTHKTWCPVPGLQSALKGGQE